MAKEGTIPDGLVCLESAPRYLMLDHDAKPRLQHVQNFEPLAVHVHCRGQKPTRPGILLTSAVTGILARAGKEHGAEADEPNHGVNA